MTKANKFLNENGYEDFKKEDFISIPKIKLQSIMQNFADEQISK